MSPDSIVALGKGDQLVATPSTDAAAAIRLREQATSRGGAPAVQNIDQTSGANDALIERTKQATAELNQVMNAFDKGIRFRVDQKTNQAYVEIVDRKTDKVLRSIPPQEMLRFAERLHEVLGMIFDTTA